MAHRVVTGRLGWGGLAWATPVVVSAWVLEPRFATNRPSYGLRETMLLLTALLAVPCVYAILRLRRRGQTGTDSWPTRIRRLLWSAVVAFAALPIVLTLAGQLVPVAGGSYPDDQIPGLTAGLLSGMASAVLASVGLGWMVLRHLSKGKLRPRSASQAS